MLDIPQIPLTTDWAMAWTGFELVPACTRPFPAHNPKPQVLYEHACKVVRDVSVDGRVLIGAVVLRDLPDAGDSLIPGGRGPDNVHGLVRRGHGRVSVRRQ